MSLHISAKEGEIARIVLLAGDPLRAKHIADNMLTGAELVNTTRNAFYYTGTYKGKRLLDAAAIERARATQFLGIDINLGTEVRWGAAGFFGNNPKQWYGPNPSAFGHSGWGGSMGYADPEAEVSVGYVLNQMDANLNGDPPQHAIGRRAV